MKRNEDEQEMPWWLLKLFCYSEEEFCLRQQNLHKDYKKRYNTTSFTNSLNAIEIQKRNA